MCTFRIERRNKYMKAFGLLQGQQSSEESDRAKRHKVGLDRLRESGMTCEA